MSTPVTDREIEPTMEDEKTLGGRVTVLEADKDVGGEHGGEHETEAVNYGFTYEQTQKLLRRVDLHLIPMLMLAYLLKNVDSNILSYMKVMNTGQPTNVLKQLHMTTNDWSYMSTVTTVPFLVFDIPSNIVLKWSTPRLHFCRIICLWSIIECCMAACTNKAGILTARFFIGVTTAGMFPGILVQLTMWYRPDELALRMACISMLGQFSGILDALLAYGVQYIDGRGGVSGWQWCFIVLGLLGFPLCAALYLWHPDYPDQSVRKWFTPEEAAYLAARLPPNAARSTDPNFSWPEIKGALLDPLTWGFGMAMLFEQTGTSGYSWWLPTIIAGFGFTSTANSQLLNIPPAVIYILAAAISSYYVDKQYRIPRPVFQLAAMIMMIGLFAGLTVLPSTSKGPLMALILLFGIPSAVFQSMIYPWRAQTVKGSSYAAFAFAFQNSIGQLAGIFSTQIFRSQYAPSYRIPFIVCNVFLACTVFAILFIWKIAYTSEKETRRVAKIRKTQGKAGNTIADVEVHDARIGQRPVE